MFDSLFRALGRRLTQHCGDKGCWYVMPQNAFFVMLLNPYLLAVNIPVRFCMCMYDSLSFSFFPSLSFYMCFTLFMHCAYISKQLSQRERAKADNRQRVLGPWVQERRQGRLATCSEVACKHLSRSCMHPPLMRDRWVWTGDWDDQEHGWWRKGMTGLQHLERKGCEYAWRLTQVILGNRTKCHTWCSAEPKFLRERERCSSLSIRCLFFVPKYIHMQLCKYEWDI